MVGSRRVGPLRPTKEEAVDDAIAAGFGSREQPCRQFPRGQAYLHPLAHIATGQVDDVVALRLIAAGRRGDPTAVPLRGVPRRGQQSKVVDGVGRVASVTWL